MSDSAKRKPGPVLTVGPDRYPEALEVLHTGFEAVGAQFGITRENDPHYPVFWSVGDVARAVARPAWLLGVEDGSSLAGCAFLGPSRRRVGCWELRHLAVRPQHRHLGLGRVLVEDAVRRSAAEGADILRIGIIAENRRLLGWYHSLGFREVSSAETYPGLPFTVIHLELDTGVGSWLQ